MQRWSATPGSSATVPLRRYHGGFSAPARAGSPSGYRFCATNFDGWFLEHIPEIAFTYDGSVERTAQILAAAGFEVDWKLWEADYSRCGPCRPGANCH
ncbi:hypothetical protein [Streptomyces sp. NPDC002855]|uniref:hypothetical protein n=1 Tax=Streptomyces sp. NPDC002855 TaxID=3154437 RepID=UPI00333336A6